MEWDLMEKGWSVYRGIVQGFLRLFREGFGCLIDVIKICDLQNVSGYLQKIHFEKDLNSLNHKFLIAVLKINGFGENFFD